MIDEIYETPPTTPHFQTELAAQLADLIPEAIADGKVDVEKLEELLDGDAADSSERFGLFWPGKKRALRAAQEPTTATLKPDFENSKDWDTTRNVFIEGDNLEVLKILQKHYHAKIKMIYIDPPYNTGQDFVYPDNYKEGLDTYLEWTRQVNDEGKKLTTNAETEGRYHSNWLNMMYPRLKLARNLLTNDGTVFISIDDNELPRLMLLVEEIFNGEEVKTIAVKMSEASGVKMASVAAAGRIPKLKEHLVLVKRGGIRNMHLDRVPKDTWDDEYKTIIVNATLEQINDVRTIRDNPARSAEDVQRLADLVGNWRTESISAYLKREGVSTNDSHSFKVDNAWRILQIASLTGGSLERVKAARNRLNPVPRFFPFVTPTGKVYLIDGRFNPDAKRPRCQAIFADENLTIHPGDFWGDIRTTGLDSEGGVEFKNGKKPLRLMERIISTMPAHDSVVLDFFAGSGTTGEAVARLNARDGGSRRYILVQLPEPSDQGGTIAGIARQRLQAAAERYRTGSSDSGFRAYKLSDTNFAKWKLLSDISEDALQQRLLILRESATDGASADELLTEILLKQGYSLTDDISAAEVGGLDVRLVRDRDGDVAVLAYLNEHVKPTLEQLRALVNVCPTRIIVLEDAFQGDDELKTNLAQLAKSKGIELWTA